MSNLRLKNHTWDAASIYDSTLQKTQAEINAEASAGGGGSVSPAVTISEITGGHRVSITDKTHPQGQSFDVMDGADGTNGENGADGVSPAVTVTEITDGHRVSITDNTGTHTFDVLNGGVKAIRFTEGGYIQTDIATGIDVTSPISNSGYRYAVVECAEGEWLEVHVNGAGAARAYAFVDAEGNRLAVANANTNPSRILIAPANTKYFVVNDKMDGEYEDSYKGVSASRLNRLIKLEREVEASVASKRDPSGLIPFEYGVITAYAGTSVYYSVSSAPLNRCRTPVGAWFFMPKGTVVQLSSEDVRLYVAKKALSGETMTTQWATSYEATEDAFFAISLKYADDRVIEDIDAVKAFLSITPPADDTQQIVESLWRNTWFFDVSHRGYMKEAPQSTLAAFVRAKQKGYNGLEVDLRLTADSDPIPVIHHNAGMPSDSNYLIAEHTLAELRENANMGSYNGVTQQILTFEDTLKIAKNLDMVLFVELKVSFTPEQIASLITTARDCGMKERVYWMASYNSSDHDYAQNFRSVDADCNLLIHNTTTASNISPFVVSGKRITFCYARVTYINSTVVKNMAAVGVDTIAWCVTFSWLLPDYTTDQVKAKIVEMLDAGVCGIALDEWTAADIVREQYAPYIS